MGEDENHFERRGREGCAKYAEEDKENSKIKTKIQNLERIF
jgi:hypothetical protein